MGILKEIWILFRKEVLLELRLKYALSGILLYVFSTFYIVYTATVGNIHPDIWIVLFWIISLFASVNAIGKSFIQENSARQLYYYSLANPIAVIISKILYNIFLLMIINILTWLAFTLISGNIVENSSLFFSAVFFGSIGFSLTFTFISAISAKSDNSATLLAILSFPLIIPILLTLINLSANAVGLLKKSSIQGDIAILLGIDFLLLALVLVLFPFLWRD